MIFPALQALTKSGRLDVPVIGVAKAGWNLDQLRERARERLETLVLTAGSASELISASRVDAAFPALRP
jgi:hypothetical protein